MQPLVRCGLTIYGDYQPSSTSTVDTRYFTNDPISFLRELRLIKFEYGGVFRNAVTEGLVSALEVRPLLVSPTLACSIRIDIAREYAEQSENGEKKEEQGTDRHRDNSDEKRDGQGWTRG